MNFYTHKYHAKPTTVAGIRFASKGEAERYLFLREEEKAGRIRDLRLQVAYPILPAHWTTRIGAKGKPVRDRLALSAVSYVADFVYLTADGVEVVEDFKGMETPEFKMKEALVWDRYGVRLSKPKRPCAPAVPCYLEFD